MSQRAHLVLLSTQHYPVSNLARLFACSRATVRLWIRRFEAGGPDGLRDAPFYPGSPESCQTVADGPNYHCIATRCATVYADESRIQTLTLVRAMWQQRGQQVSIPTLDTNRAITIFGALNLRTGR